MTRKMYKLHPLIKIILIFMIINLLAGCKSNQTNNDSQSTGNESDLNNTNTSGQHYEDFQEDYSLRILVIYGGEQDDYTAFEQLKESMIVGAQFDMIFLEDIQEKESLEEYSIVYLDSSVSQNKNGDAKDLERICLDLINLNKFIVVENELVHYLPEELLGITEVEVISERPESITINGISDLGSLKDFEEYTEILKDYHSISEGFYTTMNDENYGSGYQIGEKSVALIVANNKVLSSYASQGEKGQGGILILSGLLTNDQFTHRFDMEKDKPDDYGYQFTSSSAYRMMLDSILKFVSLEKYGVAFTKNWGMHTRPSISHQNHFEVYEAFDERVMTWYTDLLKEYRQIPSYSIIRMPFTWFDWRETIGFNLNLGHGIYQGEWDESLYGSGVKLTTEEAYVEFEKLPSKTSYYSKVDDAYKGTPVIGDLNNDGIDDVVSGSASGDIYFLESESIYGEMKQSDGGMTTGTVTPGTMISGAMTAGSMDWIVKEPVHIKDKSGRNINVGGYSSPDLYDFDDDGDLDLFVGAESGFVEIFENVGDMKFQFIGDIPSKDLYSKASPVVYDWNGDGEVDVLIGTSEGRMYVAYGSLDSMFFEEAVELELHGGPMDQHLAPEVMDYDGDGLDELLVGSNSGYVRVYAIDGSRVADHDTARDNAQDGSQDTEVSFSISATYVGNVPMSTNNRDGNSDLWSGYNSSPESYDVNGDGLEDIVLGVLEYGLAYSFDDERSPLQEDFMAEMKQAQEDYLEIYPHLYFHSYKSSEQEIAEIERYKDLFEAYDIPWDVGGTNQHTWRINTDKPWQTIQNMSDAGIWWNSGYWTIDQVDQPTYSNQWLWTLPFLYTDDDFDGDFLLYAPIAKKELLETQYDLVGKYDLPITFFSHPDAEYFYGEDGSYLRPFPELLNVIRDKYLYNFNTEPQKSKNFLAAMSSDITIEVVEGEGFKITRHDLSEDVLEKVGNYSDTVGIIVETSANYDRPLMISDSMIQFDYSGKLYVSLMDQETMLYTNQESIESLDRSSIISANMPVDISKEGKIYRVKFLDKGLQELMIPSVLEFEVLSEGFSVYDNGTWKTIYKYGDQDSLEFQMK